MQEELSLFLSQSSYRTAAELLRVTLIRVVTNGIVILLLVGMGAAIIEATIYSWNQVCNSNWSIHPFLRISA